MIQGSATTAGNFMSYLSVSSALKYVMLSLSTKEVWHHTVICLFLWTWNCTL